MPKRALSNFFRAISEQFVQPLKSIGFYLLFRVLPIEDLPFFDSGSRTKREKTLDKALDWLCRLSTNKRPPNMCKGVPMGNIRLFRFIYAKIKWLPFTKSKPGGLLSRFIAMVDSMRANG